MTVIEWLGLPESEKVDRYNKQCIRASDAEKRIAELGEAWEKAKAVPLACVYSEDGRYNYPEKWTILAAVFDKPKEDKT